MVSWEKKKVEELGDNTNVHVLGFPKDADYINELHDWAGSAEDGFAKQPPYWGEKQRQMRAVFAEIRKKFVAGGGKAKTVKEIGEEFQYLYK